MGSSSSCPSRSPGTLIAGFPFFGGVFALMLGVFAFGSEYGWGTLKTLFTQAPGRLRVFAAKLAALAIVLVPFVLALFAAGAVASYVIAQIEDAPVALAIRLAADTSDGCGLADPGCLGGARRAARRGHARHVAGDRRRHPLRVGDRGTPERVCRHRERCSSRSPTSSCAPTDTRIAAALGASVDSIESSGPGSYSGPLVSGLQGAAVLAVLIAGLVALTGLLLRRRDVA